MKLSTHRNGRKLSFFSCSVHIFFESLILAQDERWRRGLGMQVERPLLEGVANEVVTRRNLPLSQE